MKQKELVNQIIKYEQEFMPDEEMLELFSALIKNGMVWKLQGSYGRTARDLIAAGKISETGEILN